MMDGSLEEKEDLPRDATKKDYPPNKMINVEGDLSL